MCITNEALSLPGDHCINKAQGFGRTLGNP